LLRLQFGLEPWGLRWLGLRGFNGKPPADLGGNLEKRMIFKVEAQGVTLYIEAESRADASKQFEEKIGPIPSSMLTWTDDVELPDEEELL
jgi:hypothetical protein